MLQSQKHWGTEELRTGTASGGRREDGERQKLGEALPPCSFFFPPTFFVLAAKALPGHIDAGKVHRKIL